MAVVQHRDQPYEKRVNLVGDSFTTLKKMAPMIESRAEFVEGQLERGIPVVTPSFVMEVSPEKKRDIVVVVGSYRGEVKLHLGTHRYAMDLIKKSLDKNYEWTTKNQGNVIKRSFFTALGGAWGEKVERALTDATV